MTDLETWLRDMASGPMAQNPEHIETCNKLAEAADEVWRLKARDNERTGIISKALTGKIDRLRDLLSRLLKKLPHERHDLSAGWCAGCGAVHWPTTGQGKEACGLNCVLQEAIREVAEERETDNA